MKIIYTNISFLESPMDFYPDYSLDFEERSDDPLKPPNRKQRTAAHFPSGFSLKILLSY